MKRSMIGRQRASRTFGFARHHNAPPTRNFIGVTEGTPLSIGLPFSRKMVAVCTAIVFCAVIAGILKTQTEKKQAPKSIPVQR